MNFLSRPEARRIRPGALSTAALCAAATAWLLLEDVVRGQSPPTTSHVMSLLALVLAVVAGHQAWPEIRAHRIVNGVLLAAVAIGATGYVVAASISRNAETAIGKTRAVEARNAARETARQRLEEAIGDHSRAKAAADAECIKVGRQCEAKRRLVEQADSHRLLLAARVDSLGADERPNAGWHHVATVLAALPGIQAEPSEITRRLELLLPVVLTVVAELGLIAFARSGFSETPADNRSERQTVRQPARAITERAEPLTEQEIDDLRRIVRPNDRQSGPERPSRPELQELPERRSVRNVRPGISGPEAGPSGGARMSREQAEADLVTMLALGQSVPSQEALCQRWRRSSSTVSDWLRRWESDGLIPARRLEGRTKSIAAA